MIHEADVEYPQDGKADRQGGGASSAVRGAWCGEDIIIINLVLLAESAG